MTPPKGGDRRLLSAARPVGPALGAVEWFCPGEHDRVERALEAMRKAGLERLRTGVSWADYHTPGGRIWYDWLLPRLARELEILPCFTYTPPSLGVVASASAPPREPKAFADFLDVMITAHGRHFEWLELWNEPNNLNDWDWRLDPQWLTFSAMIGGAAYWARQRGKRTVLGGMCPSDPNWLALMAERGVLGYIDVVGIHAFPESWEQDWRGWPTLIAELRAVLERFGLEPELWATEAGYSTWRVDEARQIACLLHGLAAPLGRFYWYALQDLDPERATQQGFHVDERHYHFGLIRADGTPKLLHRLLAAGGIEAVRAAARLSAPALAPAEPCVVVTGGAGFVGANLADRLATEGERVLIYDSLARPGVEANADWLKQRHGARVQVEIADVRDRYTLRDAVRRASAVYHFAAQVAVTTSLQDPTTDFEVNAAGTFNLLEALRHRNDPPPLVFTSTNKVYGALESLDLVARVTRYTPVDGAPEAFGIAETQPLAFCSPYGCAKGAADQYVLDFGKMYGLPTTVFRMSCIYGPRQLGTEDQGWVAHFLRATLDREPITVYGDGRQVRDLLYVDDLVEALLLARTRIGDLQGRPFNIGGGPANAVSLLEVLRQIEALSAEPPRVRFGPMRAGDQLYYVSDTRAFQARTGWRPRVDVGSGLARLAQWLRPQRGEIPDPAFEAARIARYPT
jgi:CDP-paratose 2-epimerase